MEDIIADGRGFGKAAGVNVKICIRRAFKTPMIDNVTVAVIEYASCHPLWMTGMTKDALGAIWRME